MNLLERLRRNENTSETALSYATNVWRKKRQSTKPLIEDISETLIRSRKLARRKKLKKKILLVLNNPLMTAPKQRPIEKFRKVARQVRLLIHVFRKMRQYAVEKGGHEGVFTMSAMQLKDSVNDDEVEKDLLFDPNYFKSRYQFAIPKWARRTCSRLPAQRTEAETANMVSLMRQIRVFRKYSNKMQTLLAKIVTYERFGRRRVVIRKGHIGRCFYLVFSGSVGVVIQGDEDRAFVNEEKPANVMRKGDAFGELALIRKVARSATAVCLESCEFLVIDKEDFFELGIHKCAHEEMIARCKYMRSLDLFNTWEESVLKEVSAGGRNLEVLCDKVVEMNSTQSEFVYLVTKGHLNIIRLLALPTKYHPTKLSASRVDSLTTSGYSGSMQSHAVSPTSVTIYNDPRKLSKCSLATSNGRYSPQSNSSTNSLRRKEISPLNRPRRATLKMLSLEDNLLREQEDTAGLGAFIIVDTLLRGQQFGLQYILNAEDQPTDCERRFILVSAGCELIRIQKSDIKSNVDDETLQKIKQMSTNYCSDEDLVDRFQRYNNWRCYREQLADNMVEYNIKTRRAKTERSMQIPTLPRLIKPTCLKPPVQPKHSGQLDVLYVAAQSSEKTLVITHGGDRLDRTPRNI